MKAWKQAGFTTVKATPERAMPLGKQLYVSSCSGCHQVSGTGIPNQVPPLRGDALVLNGDGSAAAEVVLHGVNGRAIGGKTYDSGMPAFKDALSDAEVAAILTFIRNQWGNRASAIQPAVIRKARQALRPN
jgi:mono/diheme cytochrome c family protein